RSRPAAASSHPRTFLLSARPLRTTSYRLSPAYALLSSRLCRPSFFLRPAQAADRSPHGRFTQLLPGVLRPPGAVLQDGGIGVRFQPRPQRRFLLGSHAPRVARNGRALE